MRANIALTPFSLASSTYLPTRPPLSLSLSFSFSRARALSLSLFASLFLLPSLLRSSCLPRRPRSFLFAILLSAPIYSALRCSTSPLPHRRRCTRFYPSIRNGGASNRRPDPPAEERRQAAAGRCTSEHARDCVPVRGRTRATRVLHACIRQPGDRRFGTRRSTLDAFAFAFVRMCACSFADHRRYLRLNTARHIIQRIIHSLYIKAREPSIVPIDWRTRRAANEITRNPAQSPNPTGVALLSLCLCLCRFFRSSLSGRLS